MSRREWALRVLGLELAASDEDIRAAYRDLATVWHPDRHTSNERIRARAEEMMKRINSARDILLGGSTENPSWGPEPEWSAPDEPESEEVPKDPSDPHEQVISPRSTLLSLLHKNSKLAGGILAVGVLGFLALAKPADWQREEPSPSSASETSTPDKSAVRWEPRFSLAEAPPEQAEQPQEENAEEGTAERVPEYLTSIEVHEDDARFGEEANTTVRAGILDAPDGRELLRVEAGTPIRVERGSGTWSKLALQDGARGYIRSKQLASARVATKPSDAVEGPALTTAQEYFTIGSTKEEVRQIQGPPSGQDGDRWSYGISNVQFEHERVIAYHDYSDVLMVRLSPAPGTKRSTFALGSSKDEVLSAQGTPTGVDGDRWNYGISNVNFENDKVVSYHDYSNVLKVKLTPRTKLESLSFTVGSSMDEVLTAQGTPTGIDGDRWSYGISSVEFKNGKVSKYQDYSKVLKIR